MNEYKLDWYLAQQELHTPLWGASDILQAANDSATDFLLDREIERRITRMKLIAGGFAATRIARSTLFITRSGSKIATRHTAAVGVRLVGKAGLRIVPYVGTALMIADTISLAKFAWNYWD